MMSGKVLFIGNFLNSSRGTAYVTKRVIDNLTNTANRLIIASSYQNKILRLFDIIGHVLFSRFDILHIDVFSGQAFHFAAISVLIGKFLRRKKKILLNLHGGGLVDFTTRNVRTRKYVTYIFTQATIVISPSLFLKDYFEKMGFQVRYIPNFIDLDNFCYNRNTVKPFSLLWVRSFNKEYNPALAIQSFELIRKRFPDATLTMVGPDGGGLLRSMKELVQNMNLSEAVNFVGPVPNDKLATFYQRHAVFLNTTLYESFGVSLVEAASCGIPFVSSTVGEIPYLWKDGIDCLLCNQLEPSFFAEKVSMLLEDKTLCARLVTNARNKALNFKWISVSPLWHDVLTR
jgi:glycosyltransferase involved in cell wall biosynthesis